MKNKLPGYSSMFVLSSDYEYPYDYDDLNTYCPDSSGVTMDAFFTSNKVKKSHKIK